MDSIVLVRHYFMPTGAFSEPLFRVYYIISLALFDFVVFLHIYVAFRSNHRKPPVSLPKPRRFAYFRPLDAALLGAHFH